MNTKYYNPKLKYARSYSCSNIKFASVTIIILITNYVAHLELPDD